MSAKVSRRRGTEVDFTPGVYHRPAVDDMGVQCLNGGQRASETRTSHGAPGQPDDVTRYHYDDAGQVDLVTRPEMEAGRRFAGRTETRHYDPFDRLASVTQTLATGSLTTSYAYDHDGALRRVTDPDQDVEYTYDDLGRRTTEVQHREGGRSDLVTQYTEYDAEGRLVSVLDALGRSSTYGYDEVGRLTGYTPPVTAEAPAIRDITHVDYMPDANDNLDYVDVTYREHDLSTSTQKTDYTFGSFDELLSVDVHRPTDAPLATTYTYDASLNRRSVTSPQGTTSYCFDTRNRLSHAYLGAAPDCAAPPSGVLAADYAYTDDGQLRAVGLPDGSRVDYTYEQNTNALAQVQHTLTGTPGDLATYSYDHDGNGNLQRMTETLEGVRESTVVDGDALGRITRIVRDTEPSIGAHSTTFSYEGSYNRQGETIVDPAAGTTTTRNYFYEGANRIDRVEQTDVPGASTTIDYTLDAVGNTVARTDTTAGTTTNFTYDGQNQLEHVDVDGGSPLGEYAYDEQGRRARQRTAGRDISTFWDGRSPLEERDPMTGAAVAHYRYADRLLSMTEAGSEPQYYHHDGLRNTMALTRAPAVPGTPEITATYRTDLFGQIREQTRSSHNRNIYAGHENDEETGLVYMKSRYYDPALGRFLTQDTYLGQQTDAPSLNRYTYARGNPGSYWDPDGHASTRQSLPWLRGQGSGSGSGDGGDGDFCIHSGRNNCRVVPTRPTLPPAPTPTPNVTVESQDGDSELPAGRLSNVGAYYGLPAAPGGEPIRSSTVSSFDTGYRLDSMPRHVQHVDRYPETPIVHRPQDEEDPIRSFGDYVRYQYPDQPFTQFMMGASNEIMDSLENLPSVLAHLSPGYWVGAVLYHLGNGDIVGAGDDAESLFGLLNPLGPALGVVGLVGEFFSSTHDLATADNAFDAGSASMHVVWNGGQLAGLGLAVRGMMPRGTGGRVGTSAAAFVGEFVDSVLGKYLKYGEALDGLNVGLAEGLESAPPRPNVRPATQQLTGGNGRARLTGESTAARGAVRPGASGTYGELTAQRRAFGQTEPLHMDHQPSYAAQRAAAEQALGRPLTPAEARALRGSTPAVASPSAVHQQTSPTYGGRNTPARIAEDAADLGAAQARDRAVFDEAIRSRR